MSRIRTLFTASTAALMLALAAAPGAHANAFQDVYKEYASTGKIDPCHFSSKKLQDARKQVPGDINQYAPDLPDALDAAAQQRAAGGCAKKSGTTTTSTTAVGSGVLPTSSTPGAAPQTTVGAQPSTTIAAPPQTPTPSAVPEATSTLPDAALASSKDESGDNSTPVPLVLLAILAALALMSAAAVGSVRYWGFDPPWLGRMRHSVAEAGWRASAAWAEFTDWVRFGR